MLKQAGVVDSGGKGLFFILEGMLRFVHGEPLDTPTATVQPLSAMNLENTMDSIEPGQDYEVVVDFVPKETLDLQKFYSELEKIGTSIQVGEGEGMYRMHIHVPTEKRYEPIDYVMSLGTITKIAMENLIAQMEGIDHKASSARIELANIEPGQIAVVAVSPGAGISRVFASLGVAAIVEGGQTMNPSTKDILDAFENLPTDKVIILPNNKNIILAAQQAKDVTVKKVYRYSQPQHPAGTGGHDAPEPRRRNRNGGRQDDQSHRRCDNDRGHDCHTHGRDRRRFGGAGTGHCFGEWQAGHLGGIGGRSLPGSIGTCPCRQI